MLWQPLCKRQPGLGTQYYIAQASKLRRSEFSPTLHGNPLPIPLADHITYLRLAPLQVLGTKELQPSEVTVTLAYGDVEVRLCVSVCVLIGFGWKYASADPDRYPVRRTPVVFACL